MKWRIKCRGRAAFKKFHTGHTVRGRDKKFVAESNTVNPRRRSSSVVWVRSAMTLCRYIGKIGLVGDRRRARGLGHGVDVVGAVAELDAVHVGNQRGPRNAEAQPCTRQIVRFGEGMGDDEVVIFFPKAADRTTRQARTRRRSRPRSRCCRGSFAAPPRWRPAGPAGWWARSGWQ